MNKNINAVANTIAIFLTLAFVGCGSMPTANSAEQKIETLEMKNVSVQMLYNGKPTQWQATFTIVDRGTVINERKPKDDTNAYSLGKFNAGSTVRIMNDTTLNVRHTDNFLSIVVVIGNDTTTTYGIEGLYTVHTVK